jgi:hypothetical protein
MRRFAAVLSVLGILVAWAAALAGPVDAATRGGAGAAVVSPAAITSSVTPNPISFGGFFHDVATVTGSGATPTGTVDFAFYGPDDPTCSGPPADGSTGNQLSTTAGVTSATSTNFVPNAAGTYNVVATYHGDANYLPAMSACGAVGEIETVSKDNPTLSIAASGPTGGAISGTATLAGGLGPTGAITITAYGPNDSDCGNAPASTKTFAVSGNGTYSYSFVPPAAGTYEFVASYTGDANNTAVSSACLSAGSAVTVAAGLPSATTEAASAVTSSTASLGASVTPNGTDTKVVFEFGTTTSFGSITSIADVGPAFAPATVTGSLAGLSPRTTYLYRVVATNAQGTAVGAVESLTTGGQATAPIVVTSPASNVGNTGATFAGTVNPAGQSTSFTFEYGTTTSFGSITTVVELDSASSPEPVSATVAGLASNTTYLYRVVATNASGTTSGAVMSFTTGPGGPPVATTGTASSITPTAATLSGTVDPKSSQTSFVFEYGTTTSFGSISAVDSAGSTPGVQSVSLPVSGLRPSTTYVYRIDATNANGTATGVVRSFTTAGG